MVRTLSIIIVTYRAYETAARCLESVFAALDTNELAASAEVIVVDSHSDDGTANRLARKFRNAQVLELPENRGFAAGVNAGIGLAGGRHVLLLNPDTTVDGGMLKTLTQFLDTRPDVAAAGPRIVDFEGSDQSNGRRFPTVRHEASKNFRFFAHGSDTDSGCEADGHTDWISGCCMILRMSAIEEVGLFDESYFLYWEEVDWCRRARQRGWNINVVEDALVRHEGGVSAAEAGPLLSNGCMRAHYSRSRRRYFRKHHGIIKTTAVEIIHACGRFKNAVRHPFILDGAVK